MANGERILRRRCQLPSRCGTHKVICDPLDNTILQVEMFGERDKDGGGGRAIARRKQTERERDGLESKAKNVYELIYEKLKCNCIFVYPVVRVSKAFGRFVRFFAFNFELVITFCCLKNQEHMCVLLLACVCVCVRCTSSERHIWIPRRSVISVDVLVVPYRLSRTLRGIKFGKWQRQLKHTRVEAATGAPFSPKPANKKWQVKCVYTRL